MSCERVNLCLYLSDVSETAGSQVLNTNSNVSDYLLHTWCLITTVLMRSLLPLFSQVLLIRRLSLPRYLKEAGGEGATSPDCVRVFVFFLTQSFVSFSGWRSGGPVPDSHSFSIIWWIRNISFFADFFSGVLFYTLLVTRQSQLRVSLRQITETPNFCTQ